MARVLVIDDSDLTRDILSRIVKRMGHEAETAATLEEGARKADGGRYDVALLDVLLPDGNGLDLLPRLRALPDPPEVIIITAEGDPHGAGLAIENGAWDYLEKGASADIVRLSLGRALDYRARKAEAAPTPVRREGIIGESARVKECLELVGKAAAGDANVLITGETGVGKELFARAIHESSGRAAGPFVIVDCAALPDNLVESILFGHAKGAFTGADKDAEGLVAQADGGTLFLDEIGELPMSLQKSFLRVLQEKRFRPVGAKSERESDFRLVAATNRDLEKMVAEGGFREDLLFRLRSFHIRLPALRERQGDVPLIARSLVAKLCAKYGLPEKGFSDDFFDVLEAYGWPGNVRELVNAMERAVVRARHDPALYPKHLPPEIRAAAASRGLAGRPDRRASGARVLGAGRPEANGGQAAPQFRGGVPPTWREYREEALRSAGVRYFRGLMDAAGGDVERACALSGLSRPRLYALLKEHEIVKRFDLD